MARGRPAVAFLHNYMGEYLLSETIATWSGVIAILLLNRLAIAITTNSALVMLVLLVLVRLSA